MSEQIALGEWRQREEECQQVTPLILMHDTEDKGAWCKHGEVKEKLFVSRLFDTGASVLLNPAKSTDPYTHDLFLMLQCDVKNCTTPFRTAFEKFGIQPSDAVTLNVKDVERYKEKYPNICIIFDVNHEFYTGTHMVLLKSLLLRIATGKVPIHRYERRINDELGNAKDSYVLNCKMMPKLL